MYLEKLKEACVLAGGELEYVPVQKHGMPIPVWNFPKHNFGMHEEHPMLSAAVAEILVAKVRRHSWMLHVEYDSVEFWNCSDLKRPRTDFFYYYYEHDAGVTLADAIVRAALELPKEVFA